MTAKTPTEIQTAVNAIYREQLIAVVTANNEPSTQSYLADNVLGGIMPAEAMSVAMEPYVPAHLQLVADGTFVYWQDPETGYTLTDLTVRATDEQKALSEELCANAEARVEADPNASLDYRDPASFDNPANHRLPSEEMNQRIAGQQNEFQAMVAGLISQAEGGEGQPVH